MASVILAPFNQIQQKWKENILTKCLNNNTFNGLLLASCFAILVTRVPRKQSTQVH